MAKTTLLSEDDVVTMAKVAKHNFPRTEIGDIFQVERTERRVTLGAAFYDAMLDDQIDYSLTAAWDGVGPYATDETVIFEGVVYISLIDGNTSEPPAKGKWAFAPKFTDVNYEYLWCSFLGRYLALHVVATTVPAVAAKLSGSGVIKSNSAVHNPAAKEDRDDLSGFILAEIVRVFENMHEYLKGSDATVFDGYAGKGATLCDLSDVYTLVGGERFFYGSDFEEEAPAPIERHRLNANIYRLG